MHKSYNILTSFLQISELLKLGSQSYEDLKEFSCAIEEFLFYMPAVRDRALTYKTEEVQLTAVDEFYVEQDKIGRIQRQIARVRVFALAFLSGSDLTSSSCAAKHFFLNMVGFRRNSLKYWTL